MAGAARSRPTIWVEPVINRFLLTASDEAQPPRLNIPGSCQDQSGGTVASAPTSEDAGGDYLDVPMPDMAEGVEAGGCGGGRLWGQSAEASHMIRQQER